MSQQINLFDAALRPSREVLTLRNAALAAGLALVIILLAGMAGLERERQAKARFRQVEAQLKTTQDRLTALAARQAARHIDPRIEAEIAAARLVLQGKDEILARLERGDLGDRTGFSGYMRGFARQVPEGVWLTGFDLSAAGRNIEIRGRMQSESLLPAFMQRLNREEIFRGRRFSALDLRRVEPAKPATDSASRPFVEFTLAGQPVQGEKAAP